MEDKKIITLKKREQGVVIPSAGFKSASRKGNAFSVLSAKASDNLLEKVKRKEFTFQREQDAVFFEQYTAAGHG